MTDHAELRARLNKVEKGWSDSDGRLKAFFDVIDVRALLAERDAMKATLEVALEWHESQDKAISKQPNANTGHNGWMRAEHQEQAAVIRAALAQEEG